MKEETNKTIEVIKGISMFLLFFILPILLQLLLYKIIIKSNITIRSIILLLIELCTTLFYLFVYHKEFKGCFKDYKENFKEYSDLMIKAWLLGFIGMFVSNLLINIGLGMEMANNEEANRSALKMYIYAIPTMSLLGPITEELAFRTTFKKIIKKKKVFIFVTALLFAGAHLLSGFSSLKDMLYIFPYFSLGFAMSYVYAKTDNVLTNITIHILHNSLTLLLYYIVL